MKKTEVAKENHAFFVVVVGMVMCYRNFQLVVLQSLNETTQYGVEMHAGSGYIRVDSSQVKDQCAHGIFSDMVRSGILSKVAMQVPSLIHGELNDKAEVIYNNYKFSFSISSYERDGKHSFETVTDLASLPQGEKLGRVVDLKITVL